jgi:hypothetical protein
MNARDVEERGVILDALIRFVEVKPGLEYANYGDVKAYRKEARAIARDRADFYALLGVIYNMHILDNARLTGRDLLDASVSAFGGRLEINVNLLNCTPPVGSLNYTVGQYRPTEYRKAACALLANTLWQKVREHKLPAPTKHVVTYLSTGKKSKPMGIHEAMRAVNLAERYKVSVTVTDLVGSISQGEWMRRYFRTMFGRGLAARWFN